MKLTQERIAEIEELALPHRKSHRPDDHKSFHIAEERIGISSLVRSKDGYGIGGDKELFDTLIKLLGRSGFKMKADPDYTEHYRTISKYHRLAKNGALYCSARYYTTGMEISFYPEYATGNPHGPKYCSNKFQQMNYLDQKHVELIQKKVRELLVSKGFEDRSKPVFSNAREQAEFNMRSCWHFYDYDTNEGTHPYLKDTASYNGRDTDKKPLRNGMVKYFYDWDGTLKRGTIYYSLNSMWYVVLNKHSITQAQASDLFDYSPERCSKTYLHRHKINQMRSRLDSAIRNGDEKTAGFLRAALWKIDGGLPGEEPYVIECVEHARDKRLWWRGGRKGYTEDLRFAGHYTKAEAESICRSCKGRGETAWRLADAERLTKPSEQTRAAG